MRQPYRRRRVKLPPRYNNFKPSGIPRRMLQTLILTVDEYEAIRLADYEQLQHEEAGRRMDISRPTFTRLVEKARQKVAIALMEGHELVIEGGNVDFTYNLYKCRDCGDLNETERKNELSACPDCGSYNMENLIFKHRARRRGNR